MTRAKTAITLLLDGPTPRNDHLAKAIQAIVNDEYLHLEATIGKLEQAVLAHYDSPGDRQVSEANGKRADELFELTSRYDNHMRRHFHKDLRWTEQAVKLALTLTPVINLPAVRHLNAEIVDREPGDKVHDGHRDAMIEVADFIPHMREALNKPSGDFSTPNDRRRLQEALDALDAAHAIISPHRGQEETATTDGD